MDPNQFPNHWKFKPLNEIARVITGKTPPTKNSSCWNGSIPFVTPGELKGNAVITSERTITEEGLKFVKALPYGTVLVSCIGYIGKVGVVETSIAVTNQQINSVIPNEDILDNWYLAYAFIFLEPFLKDFAGITTVPIINKSSFELVNIPLPPLPEQRAIARALRAVQAAREARLREIALERERKAALMEHLFTHGTRGEPTKMTEIGEMPESWEIVKLGNLLREQLRNGHSANASNSINGVRTLTLTAVTKNDFSVKNTKITVADRLKVKDLWIEPGDIFIERANTPEFVGLASFYEGPKDFAVFPDLMVRVRLRENDVDPKFLVEFLLTDRCRNYYRRNAASTTGNMPKIDQGTIERTQIPLPKDFSEQKQIAEICRACDSNISTLDQEARLLDELFRAMLEELMTGRLRAGALATP